MGILLHGVSSLIAKQWSARRARWECQENVSFTGVSIYYFSYVLIPRKAGPTLIYNVFLYGLFRSWVFAEKSRYIELAAADFPP